MVDRVTELPGTSIRGDIIRIINAFKYTDGEFAHGALVRVNATVYRVVSTRQEYRLAWGQPILDLLVEPVGEDENDERRIHTAR